MHVDHAFVFGIPRRLSRRALRVGLLDRGVQLTKLVSAIREGNLTQQEQENDRDNDLFEHG